MSEQPPPPPLTPPPADEERWSVDYFVLYDALNGGKLAEGSLEPTPPWTPPPPCWIQGAYWRHGFWIRFWGWGFGLEDHRLDPPLFEERNSGRYGRRRRAFYLHLGPWCLRVFRDRWRPR